MNKLLVVSDSHGNTKELEEINERHVHIVNKIHCGDSELITDDPLLKGYTTVRGNCDYIGKFPHDHQFEIDQLRVYVTHGDEYGVKSNLTGLINRAKSFGANIVCYGHSHIASAEVHDGILMINPGSTRLPKGGHEESYAIVSWDDRSAVKVDFYDINGRLIDGILKNNVFSI